MIKYRDRMKYVCKILNNLQGRKFDFLAGNFDDINHVEILHKNVSEFMYKNSMSFNLTMVL